MFYQSDPIVTCESCGRKRNCNSHLNAEFPPEAAERWLKKSCPDDKVNCHFAYRAGLMLNFKDKGATESKNNQP